MGQDELNAIRRRKFNKSIVEACYGIFKILFPNTPVPDNPYVFCPTAFPSAESTRTIEEYSVFVGNQVSRTLAPILTRELPGDSELVMESFVCPVLERTLPQVLFEWGEAFRGSKGTQAGTEVGER